MTFVPFSLLSVKETSERWEQEQIGSWWTIPSQLRWSITLVCLKGPIEPTPSCAGEGNSQT